MINTFLLFANLAIAQTPSTQAPPVNQASISQIKETCKAEGKAGKELLSCISEKRSKKEEKK